MASLALLMTAVQLLLALPAADAVAQTRPQEKLIDLVTREPGQDLLAPPPRTFGGAAGRPVAPSVQIDRSKPLNLSADKLTYDTGGNRVIASGNVQIFYNNYALTADQVIYDQSANTLTASGNVRLQEPNGNIIRAEAYTLTDDFRDGFVRRLQVTTSDETQITADRAVRREGNITEFTNGKFTPCKSSGDVPPLWCISAARVVHDQSQATITYQDATFDLFGVPILYLPYFQHPDPSVKRRSGFLIPEYGVSNNLGHTVEVPYYVSIAPNMDFLFHPLYSTKQGMLWQGDFRHRLANGQYTVKFSGIDQGDTDDNVSQSLQNTWRGSIETKGLFKVGSWWSLGWNGILESDDAFRRFYKLDNILQTDRVNTVFLTGLNDRNYFSMQLYHFGGLLLSDTSQSESQVHPIIDYNYLFADPVLGGELSWDTNALSFSRDDGAPGRDRTFMSRVSTEVKWRRRMSDAIGITYTPFANLRGDVYQLENYFDPVTATYVSDDQFARGIATGGATISYPLGMATAAGTHVIEPIAQVVARQAHIPQRRYPDEDARSLSFDITNLFDVDKFSGLDRVQSGTRANAGVQYTFQSRTGGYASLVAGQSFHLAGNNAYADPGLDADGKPLFNPTSGLETKASDYVIGGTIAPTAMFRLVSQARFDEDTLGLRRHDTFARFAYGPVAAQAAYAFTAADPTLGIAKAQQDIYASIGLRLTDRWSLLGSMRFDLDASERIQDVVQLRYADECLVLTFSYTDTLITDPTRDIQPDHAFMVRFELKHLGEFRYKTDVLDSVFAENQPPKL